MAHRSFPPPLDVKSLNSPQQNWSVFPNIGSLLLRSSEQRNEATASPRWRPTEKHKKLLEELFAAGIRNPTPEDVTDIVGLLKLYGDVEEKNVFYWFQNMHSRKRRKEQKNSMQESRKEITELSLGSPCTSSTSVNNIMSEASMNQAEFSPEEDASSSPIEGALMRLIIQQHFDRKQQKLTINQNSSSANWNSSSTNAPARNIICQPSMNIATFSPQGLAISTEYEKRAELLELFPLSPTLKRKGGGE